MLLCNDLVAFVDGELDAEHATAFRVHLRCCDACQSKMIEAIELSARLSSMSATDGEFSASLTDEEREVIRARRANAGRTGK